MFGLGFSEILVILVVALLVLGPEKLPGVARSLGKTVGEFRRALDEVRRELNIGELEQDLNSLKRGRLTVSDLGIAENQPNSNCDPKPPTIPPEGTSVDETSVTPDVAEQTPDTSKPNG